MTDRPAILIDQICLKVLRKFVAGGDVMMRIRTILYKFASGHLSIRRAEMKVKVKISAYPVLGRECFVMQSSISSKSFMCASLHMDETLVS